MSCRGRFAVAHTEQKKTGQMLTALIFLLLKLRCLILCEQVLQLQALIFAGGRDWDFRAEFDYLRRFLESHAPSAMRQNLFLSLIHI